ncbi:MAG: hypothetical protein QOF31_2155 [Mycobacterium sp.]|jgi:hypothetical protein|nr:hypothetical protein [Mycobacterium sp.]
MEQPVGPTSRDASYSTMPNPLQYRHRRLINKCLHGIREVLLESALIFNVWPLEEEDPAPRSQPIKTTRNLHPFTV